MKKIVKKHPLAIRWFHWLNFPILALMIWSGLLIYWANSVYKVSIGNTVLFNFFPDNFFKALHVPFRLAEGMNWHFAIMWLFFFNGLLYVLYIAFSGEWRHLLPGKKSFGEAWQVLKYDLHLSKQHPPQIKYNGAQKITYTAVIVMGLGSLITGLAIYKPVQFNFLRWLCGGYSMARAEHFILTIGFVLFFLVHILQVIKTGWNNFQSMITGVEVIKTDKTPAEDAKV